MLTIRSGQRALPYFVHWIRLLAESTGFEPVILSYNALAVRWHKPLAQLSIYIRLGVGVRG